MFGLDSSRAPEEGLSTEGVGDFGTIPDAPYYVVSDDAFMSHWGRAAGRANRCVVPCRDMREALRVQAYAMSRREQSNVRVSPEKPKLEKGVYYSLVKGWVRRSKIWEEEQETCV